MGLFGWAFGFVFWHQKPKVQPNGLFLWAAFFRSTFLKVGLTLLLAFGFLFFEIGGIKNSFIVVSREIKIEGIFYTCLTKQLSAFL